MFIQKTRIIALFTLLAFTIHTTQVQAWNWDSFTQIVKETLTSWLPEKPGAILLFGAGIALIGYTIFSMRKNKRSNNEASVVRLFHQKYSNPDENLDGDEIKTLLEDESNLKKVRDSVTRLDDANQISDIDTKIKQAWKEKSDYLHIFCVGTMSQEYINSSGHWFTVVAQKF